MGLKERVEELRKRNNIDTNAKLLRLIYSRLGKNPDESRKGEANFIRMLNDEENRKLPVEYAAALVDIFGVDLDYLLFGKTEKKGFKNRGIEYTAFQDSLEAYKKLYNETNKDGDRVFGNYDEFENSIIDYIAKYHSINGVKFLFENKLCFFIPSQNSFSYTENFYLKGDEELQNQLIKMIFEIDDFAIFENAFRMEMLFDDFLDDSCLVFKDDFIKACLNSDNIFNGLIKYKHMDLGTLNYHPATNSYTTREIYTCNPLINYMIKYAVTHEDEYPDKIISLLNNASNNNYHIVNHIKNDMGLRSVKQLKITKQGMVLDYYYRLGAIAVFDYPISPELSENTRRYLNELKSFANQITFRDIYNTDGSIRKQWLREGNTILRNTSSNEVEYEMLEKMNNLGYDGVPKLIETKNSIDRFEYIEGEVKDFSGLPENWELAVARYLGDFHNVCKEKVGKIYCHNSIDYKSIIFDDDNEVKAIVDWRNCSVGNPEDDLIKIVINCIGIENTFYSLEREKCIVRVVKFLEEYVNNSQDRMYFGDKLKAYLEKSIECLDKSNSRYKDRFCRYKQALIFAELYIAELNEF